MKLLLAAACMLGCGPGLRDVGKADYRNPRIEDYVAELSEASRKDDVAAVRAMLRDSVTVGGLWFEDIECVKQFTLPGEVRGPKLDELARCLTTIDLEASARTDALPDVAVLTYAPGIELEARFVDGAGSPWLTWIGYVARRDLEDALPTISATVLEAQRVEGERNPPLADPSQYPELSIGPSAYAWLKVCIDIGGQVTGAHVREATSPKAARTFAAATRSWQFRPFLLGTQPAPVCSMVLLVHPADKVPKRERLPLPLPSTPGELTNVPNPMLGKRVAGNMLVTPDDKEKVLIEKAALGRLLGAFHYCIDETGQVTRVAMIRSTGLERYDRRLMDAIRGWAYRAFLDEGKPVAVCSSVHFIYNQDSRRQPGQMR